MRAREGGKTGEKRAKYRELGEMNMELRSPVFPSKNSSKIIKDR